MLIPDHILIQRQAIICQLQLEEPDMSETVLSNSHHLSNESDLQLDNSDLLMDGGNVEECDLDDKTIDNNRLHLTQDCRYKRSLQGAKSAQYFNPAMG